LFSLLRTTQVIALLSCTAIWPDAKEAAQHKMAFVRWYTPAAASAGRPLTLRPLVWAKTPKKKRGRERQAVEGSYGVVHVSTLLHQVCVVPDNKTKGQFLLNDWVHLPTAEVLQWPLK
jgi:hypothetical protein